MSMGTEQKKAGSSSSTTCKVWALMELVGETLMAPVRPLSQDPSSYGVVCATAQCYLPLAQVLTPLFHILVQDLLIQPSAGTGQPLLAQHS